ncbi:MAG: S41 family peptidase [Rikenellaceae bacterium]
MLKRGVFIIGLFAIFVANIVVAKDRGRDFDLVRNSEIMVNILKTLSEGYVDTLSTNQLIKDATRGMAKNIDPYTSYYDEQDMTEFEMMTTGKYGGIGSVIRQDGDYVVVAQPYKGSPADRAGLRIGDKIVKIDGEQAKGLTTQQVSERLKGTPNSNVTVVVNSVIDSTERKVKIKRERISIPAIPYYDMLNDKVGYIKHADFTEGSYESMRGAINDLKSRGMSSLVLDYRSNGGGILQESIDVLSLFLPIDSEVLTIRSRGDSTIYRTRYQPILDQAPLIVMIDGHSASAAEIVAGAIQDLDRGVLIGERSFGKGLVQSTIPVGYDSFLKLTTSKYFIPSGRSIQAIDYSNHGEDREVKRTADSLYRKFYTAGGREVYDGGGILPDIECEQEYMSRYAATLYSDGVIDRWGNSFYRRNYQQGIDSETFEISDDEWDRFVEMVESSKIEYKSSVALALKELTDAAERDRNEELLKELKPLEGQLHDDTQSNLRRYREEIEQEMVRDIILRFDYIEGVLRYSLKHDEQIDKAIELLTDSERIEQLLTAGVNR